MRWTHGSGRANVSTSQRMPTIYGGHGLSILRDALVSPTKHQHINWLSRIGTRAKIARKCANDATEVAKRGELYRYPGWETALSWFHKSGRIRRSGRYWITPPALYRKLDAEFQFDFDPCPSPLPKSFNSLNLEWGHCNYVNPPFRKDDVASGHGATAFVRKAITEQRKGKTSILLLPVFEYVTLLLEAGAQIRPLGRVPFHDVDSHRPAPHPANIACFVLRGKATKRPTGRR